MFTCLWNIWDWIDPPPFFNQAAMENKKMHHMQQQQSTNAQLAAQAKLYSQHHQDYRATQQSPANVFQSHPQYQSLASNFAQVNSQQPHHQSQHGQPPQLHVKPLGSSSHNHHHGGHYNLTEEQAGLLREQMMYQSSVRERQQQHQQLQPPQPSIRQQPPMSHQQPATELQHQYQQLQQAKMQAQMKTQNEAFIQQQRTFAMRQHLNPPVPNAQLHQMQSQQQSLASIPMHLQAQQTQPGNRSVPPSSLNLTNQFQPANGPMTIMNNNNNPESQYGSTNNAQLNHHVHHHPQQQSTGGHPANLQHYMHQQQTATSPDQIIIQQNHPGLVTNQACQTQISGQVHRNKQQPQQPTPQIGSSSVQTTPSTDSTPSSPAHALLDRKKSAGSIALKSPMSKRPTNSPITLTGWLYKQGSDGLKVWRKRWFVLSEYCLYYYKGPEEEKLLGSVLLPSYRIAACTPDDKINRKFAFKCEHVNMRTYWLAADTAEVMGQWVRALTAATMMQGSSASSDQMSQPSVSSLNHSAENSDSGIHTYQSNKLGVLPNGSGGSGTTPASVSDNGANLLNGGGPQPLYANAPPKPRRANDGGYSSPSPEHSMDRFDTSYDSRNLEVSGGQRGDVKSPNPMNDPLYEVRCQLAKSNDPELAARMQQQLRLDYNKSPGVAQPQQQPPIRNPYAPENGYNGPNVEDIYQMRMGAGRSQMRTGSTENILKLQQKQQMMNTNTYPDRAELLREKELYLQRLQQQQSQQQLQLMAGQASGMYPNNDRRTPDTYGRSRSGGPSVALTNPQQMGRQGMHQDPKRVFSDYEDIYNMENSPNPELVAAYRRPMSPLSNQVAGYFEGAELHQSQAQQLKMRSRPSPSSAVPRPHSADFLEYEARNAKERVAGPTPPAKPQAPRPKSSLDINRTPDNYYYSEENYAEKLRQSAIYKPRTSGTSAGASPATRPNPGSDYQQDMIDYERNYYAGNADQRPPSSGGNQSRSDYMSPQQEQFLRSASARLPRVPREDDPRMVPMTGRDGERKREESMKRLLEWKQRMLQSPLTRKGGNHMSTVPDRPKSAVHMTQGLLQRSRSETNANAGYNSYSSDDEDGPKLSSSAGRSTPSSPRTHNPSSPTQLCTGRPNSTAATTTPDTPAIHIAQPQSPPSITTSVRTNVSSATLPRPKTANAMAIKLSGQPQFKECHSTPNAPAVASSVQEIPKYIPVYEHKTAVRVDSLKSDTDSNNSKLFQIPALEDVITTPSPINIITDQMTEIELPLDNIDDDSSMQFEGNREDVTVDPVIEPERGEEEEEEDEVLSVDFDCNENVDDEGEEFEYTDEDLDEALQTEDNEIPTTGLGGAVPENLDLIPCEGHYMPMTPKRLISRENSGVFSPDSELGDSRLTPINLPSTTTSGGLTMATTTEEVEEHSEENHYVEMTQGKIISVLSDDYKSNYETICIPPKDCNQEPVYMELSHSNSSVLKPMSPPSHKRHANPANLPDILSPTQSLPPPTGDTSDDDVERERVDEIKASNLVARAMKPKTRFSLSDTFRPASYYLGPTTNTSGLQECADSSDSEIVSPPPIPKSPPPIEDLKGSGEAFQMDNVDTIKRNKRSDVLNQSFEAIPKFSASDLALHKAEGHKTSRLSLPDQLYNSKYVGKRKLDLAPTDYISLSTYSVENKTYTASVTSCNTDDGSNTSSDYDLYNKLKLESPSFMSESVYNSNRSLPIPGHSRTASEAEGSEQQFQQQQQLELRHSDTETERRNKRRPLSEDSISELDLAGDSHTFDEAPEHSHLDQYLGKLSQPSYNYTESSDQTNWIHESLAKIGEIHYIKPPEVFRTDNDSFYENLTMIAKQQLTTALPQELPPNGNPTNSNAEVASVYDVVPNQKVVTLKEKNLSLHNAQLESEDRKSGFNLSLPMEEVDQQSINCTAPIHSRGNSNVSDGSAPYYYSDLCRSNAEGQRADEAKLLNNQREIEKRKHGISHIHNPLQEASYIAKPSASEIDTRNLYENEGGNKLDAKGMHKESAASLTRMKTRNSDTSLTRHDLNKNGGSTRPHHILKNNDTYTVVNKTGNMQQQQMQQQQQQLYNGHSLSSGLRKAGSYRDVDQMERETVSAMRNLDVSAGDLLSRTHEELVLLLIQLRRQNTSTARTIEQCCTEIHEVQNKIRTSEGPARTENISRLDSLKQQLVELEKQYEKGKPLVNLVDNMVKLGSLYRSGSRGSNLMLNDKSLVEGASDRLEFNQRMQEQRLLQEERRNWDRISPNHNELQTKVQQLYQLDQLMQEESGTLQSLQRDKENLERALGGLRSRLQSGGGGPPLAMEAARKQQHALERELSRVHQLLAENSKKLEQTVAGNARLEQELLVLRQKLQATRGSKASLNALAGSQPPETSSYPGSAVLESDVAELRRVQQLVGDMQRQRQELSQAVRQLTDNSNQMSTDPNLKKRPGDTSWMETDLDSNRCVEHERVDSTRPLYVETAMNQYRTDAESSGMDSGDDLLDPAFAGLSQQEKQEIKTVRIVKRESGRRQRESRERSHSTSISLDHVHEEESFVDDFQDLQNYRAYHGDSSYEQYNSQPEVSMNFKNPFHAEVTSSAPGANKTSTDFSNYYPVSMTERTSYLGYDYGSTQSNTTSAGPSQHSNVPSSTGSRLTVSQGGLKGKTESIQSLNKSLGDLSPVFQSEAARQIIYEMSGNTSEENSDGKMPLSSNKHRRTIPKEKRRHNTAPNNVLPKSAQQQLQQQQHQSSENDMNKPNVNWRARDDLDMEVALRPRMNAPDVVRSAMAGGQQQQQQPAKEKLTEATFDNLFGAPNKIVIPERYVPEQLPELSAEEKKKRQEKVEAIKRMLSEAPNESGAGGSGTGSTGSQISAEKKQREHLLQLNQILAQQVMQMSKIVAEKSMAALPSKVAEFTGDPSEGTRARREPSVVLEEEYEDDEDDRPEPLPLYQQRYNFYS